MTFQVGIVGTDGVLLASDSRLSNRKGQTWTSRKMKIRNDQSVAYCCAGDNCSSIAANYYVESLITSGGANIEQGLINAKKRAESERYCEGAFLIAQKQLGRFQLWCVALGPDCDPYPDPISDRRWIGDERNPAAFFLERYIPRGSANHVALESLTLIAVHAIVMAATLNSRVVDDEVEMVLCRHGGGIEQVTNEEIDRLKRRSISLDSEIASRLALPLSR